MPEDTATAVISDVSVKEGHVKTIESVQVSGESLMCGNTVVAPAVVAASTFSPADATLVHSNETASASRHAIRETSSNGRENLHAVLENRFHAERSTKETEIRVLEANANTLRDLNATRFELANMIKDEAQRTRELIRDGAALSTAAALVASQMDARFAALAALFPAKV